MLQSTFDVLTLHLKIVEANTAATIAIITAITTTGVRPEMNRLRLHGRTSLENARYVQWLGRLQGRNSLDVERHLSYGSSGEGGMVRWWRKKDELNFEHQRSYWEVETH